MSNGLNFKQVLTIIVSISISMSISSGNDYEVSKVGCFARVWQCG